MEAGLAPGQVRRGLRIMKDMVAAWDAFFERVGHKFYFLEPLSYNSAILYERARLPVHQGKGKDEVDRPRVPARGSAARAARREHAVPEARSRLDGPGALVGHPRRDPGGAVGEPEDVQDRRGRRGRLHVHGGGVLRGGAPSAGRPPSGPMLSARPRHRRKPRIARRSSSRRRCIPIPREGSRASTRRTSWRRGSRSGRSSGGTRPLTPERYAERLKDFRRTNPKVTDPSRLSPGQKILVPSGGGREAKDDGKTVGYTVKKGDSLSGIYVLPRRSRREREEVPRRRPGDQSVGQERGPHLRGEDAAASDGGVLPRGSPGGAGEGGRRRGTGRRRRRSRGCPGTRSAGGACRAAEGPGAGEHRAARGRDRGRPAPGEPGPPAKFLLPRR